MKIAAASLALALLCACGGPTTVLAPQPSTALAGRTKASDAKTSGDLLYVGGDREGYVFSYPRGKIVQKLPLGSFGMCGDRAGDVFFTGVGTITEYAHGASTPKAIFRVTGTAYSCAVDPVTNDLAVVVLCLSECKGDEIAIFSHVGTPPLTYQDSAMQSMLYCGFDGRGSLYVDGYSNNVLTVAELPSGSDTFTNYAVHAKITNPGQIQWDTRHMTLEERYHPVIYRLRFSSRGAQVVRKVTFTQEGVRAAQSWIFGHAVAIPNGPATKRPLDIRIWSYPAGGAPIQILAKFIPRHREIDGVVYSAAPSP